MTTTIVLADDEALLRFATDHVNEAGNGAEEIRTWLLAHGCAHPGAEVGTRDAVIAGADIILGVQAPDPGSIAFLRQVGIRSVVVLPDRLAGTPWDGLPARPVDGLGITREGLHKKLKQLGID